MMVQYDVKRVTKGAENFMVSFDFAKTPITQVADYIIIAAQKSKTSDIHFDPRDEGMMVRFRIDGDCQDYTFIPKAYERNLTTRLKLLANMNITETRLPQDGAIKGQFGDTYMDMRVACLPTNQGEKIVIRILDYTRSLQGIDSLGFHPKNLEKIHHMMGVPNGIILVTGATGSGKSTTTYSMLSALNKPEINVITVEDPVEMNIEGINQVQVNSEIGMTFAAALRSILREDPNVILIGEIRDSETAQIAVRASITGHLVMSTLHTNNALATVERLLDMDVERYLLSTALTGIISQRLAKQLCQDCKIQREPTKYEKKVYKKFLHEDVKMVWDANPKGCDNCRKGYKGRIAVHEVLLLDDKIRNALNNENMSKDDFAKMIYGGNTISMLQDALIKSLEGQTSFEEVYKTIEIENEDEDNYAEELEGVTIKNTAEEETQEETKTDEDEMSEEQTTTSTLTEKYEIPGITTNEKQPETSETFVEQTEVEVPNFQTEEVQSEQPAEEVPVEQTEIEVPNFQTEEVQSEQPTEEVSVEQTEIEIPNYQTEEVQSEQPAEEAPVEQTEVEIPNYQTEEIQSEQSAEEDEEPENYFTITTNPEEQTTPEEIVEEQKEEETTDEHVEDYFSVQTDGTYQEPSNEENEISEEDLDDTEVENYISTTSEETVSQFEQVQSLGEESEQSEFTEVEVPNYQIDTQTQEIKLVQTNNVQSLGEENEQPETFEIPKVDETPTEEVQTESTEVEVPNNQIETQEQETEISQVEEQNETTESINIGYTIVMPDEEQQQEFNEDIEINETEEQQETINETSEETPEENENQDEQQEITSSENISSTLDQLVDEVTEEEIEEEVREENENNKYTISATNDDKEQTKQDAENDDTFIAPIVDEDDDDSEEENESEENQYQKTNNIYYEEDPIDLTIDIKTDLDQLMLPETNLEKLDETKDIEDVTKIEQAVEETSNEDNSLETQQETHNEENQEEQQETPNEENQEEQPEENEYPEDDYEYDYEYDDYDFDKEENDYTEEEQAYFNQTNLNDNEEETINTDIEINTINPEEGTAPNIQAISAVPDVTETDPKEEHTGSSILTDPGIRIADDGSINQSANINADPILPNYED